MPTFIDPNDGFPFWGNPSPQKSTAIPGRQVRMMIEDVSINQVFSGRADEIGIIQKPIPKQGKVEGYAANGLQENGHYGSTLYDQIMKPYEVKP